MGRQNDPRGIIVLGAASPQRFGWQQREEIGRRRRATTDPEASPAVRFFTNGGAACHPPSQCMYAHLKYSSGNWSLLWSVTIVSAIFGVLLVQQTPV
jgi:hypothetical protein